ncbi:hypothetical protein [Streptomyces sp. MBT53]|uniref:hypothetical protein n=1 Tax=Streptomyces sp. MBT53 TaxID=1488384 RepID=UPI00191391DA|nr:hypothetical protein [Streptomyces sp. MBT53]MBK6011710.1 hypothetical protein [Streptomyces sp. MBT53]
MPSTPSRPLPLPANMRRPPPYPPRVAGEFMRLEVLEAVLAILLKTDGSLSHLSSTLMSKLRGKGKA